MVRGDTNHGVGYLPVWPRWLHDYRVVRAKERPDRGLTALTGLSVGIADLALLPFDGVA
jgi:hypothetical protein